MRYIYLIILTIVSASVIWSQDTTHANATGGSVNALRVRESRGGYAAAALDTIIEIDSVYYDDLVGSAAMGKVTVSNGATWDDDSCALSFSGSSTQYAAWIMQLPHSYTYRAGIDSIYPHLHWITIDTFYIAWRLSYSITNIGGVSTPWSEAKGPIGRIASNGGRKHQISMFAGIPCSGLGISSIIRFRVSRDVTADEPTSARYVLAFDIHYPRDKRGGSKHEYSRE